MVLLFLSTPAYSQNTKGDRPVNNQRKIRETKVKSVRKREKGQTRDVANRRLRTKDQSSANRANAKYPQPSPYSRRAGKQPDKYARPLGRVFSRSPRESKTRAWKGDVSGYPLKRVKASSSEAARNNVYPQKGPYVRYARKQPKKRPPVYSRTIKGTRFVSHTPRYEERAWKGGVDSGPIKNKSASGTIRNVYSQKGPYVAYYNKRRKIKEKPVSNSKQLGQARQSRAPRSGGSQGRIYPASISKPYIQRGKKNVYWGKFSRKEKPFTSDIAGGPLRTRNYKSSTVGLVGRDTLKFFGRKPLGDRSTRVIGGGYATVTKRGQRGWKGDLSGWRLRKSAKGKPEVAGKFVFPRKLSISGKGEKSGRGIPGGGFKTGTRRGEQAQLNSIPNVVYYRNLSGKVKGVKSPKGGGSVSHGWNNSGRPIQVRAPGLGSVVAARFSGTFKQDQARRVFSGEGPGYSGNIRKSSFIGFSREGAGYSGNIKRSSVRGFSREGVDYSGTIKRNTVRGFSRDGGDYSGNIKRSTVRGFSRNGVDYSGNIARSSIRGFSKEGVDYSGTIKRSQVRGFGREGVDYSGNMKQRRHEKGGGSASGVLWNNLNQSVTRSSITPAGVRAARYPGNIERVGAIKTFEENGVGYSGKINRSEIHGFNRNGAGFSGTVKAKRLEKGGGSVSGTLWNNDNKALNVRPPVSKEGDYSGKIALPRFKKTFVQNSNASKESLKKKRPDETTYRVAGLQIKVHEKQYKKKLNASPYSLPGMAPTKSSVKASEYARSMKQYWHYKHNPNSSDDALKVILPGKAMARINDFQGNVKMHKFSGSRLHPDAQFAHGYRDNVKEERTFLMNVKLTWGKLFRKSETQPENLKEKIRRPRYDKREKGMWNE